jgi:DNA-binding transcriptional ArsR family regulator
VLRINISGENRHYAKPQNVSGKAKTPQPDRQKRVLFNIFYLSSCLNKQIDYLCAMDNNSCIRQQADIKQINRCKDRVSELNCSFDYLSNGLELAGNNVRLKILFLLYEEKRLCVCDISDILGMTISAVSQHLRKLKDRKLIETEREAQTIFYSLTKEYEKMLKPFFKILDENKILETL